MGNVESECAVKPRVEVRYETSDVRCATMVAPQLHAGATVRQLRVPCSSGSLIASG